MQLNNVPAVITGGASGLGAGAARVLAAAGAKVAILDLQMDKAQALANELGGIAIPCDVSSASNAEAAMAKVQAELGPCGIAVNCAGIATANRILGKDGPMALEMFSKTINVNLVGSFNILRLAAAQMQQRAPNADGERGVIISTASIAAYEGQIGQAAYAASKGGVVAMTLPAARELARFGIRVLAIAPGLFLTPMMQAFPQEVQDALAAGVPFPSRLGTPEDYAKLAKHIIENDMLNGEVIRLDGAIRLAPR